MAVDFDTLLNGPIMAVLGEPALYERPFEAPFEVRGVFRQKHLAVDFGQGAPTSAQEVTFRIRLSDFPARLAPQQADRVQVRGMTWTVQDVQRIGVGAALLVLSARVEPDLA